MSLEKVPWDFCDDFTNDQCRCVEGDLKNMFNIVGTPVIRVEGF